LGTEEDLVVGRIATAKDLSNTPEGGVSLKERTLGKREMEGQEIGRTGYIQVDPKLGELEENTVA